jgi:hypothetical protein
VAEGMVSEGPAEIRGRVRDWLTERLEAADAQAALPEPDSWSDWDERLRR